MKVLLIADRPGWAYDILAQSIKNGSMIHDIDIEYIINIRRNPTSFDLTEYDVTFFFLWFDGMRYGPSMKGFEFNKTCVGVHSHSWEKRGLTVEQASAACNQFAATGYISKMLDSVLFLENGFFTPNGVDSKLFKPSPLPPLSEINFMWVGNPSSSHHGHNKAYHSIVEPTCIELGVKLLTATPTNPIPRNKMGEFYAQNHVLICASEHEGGPLPIIESLASARPVISTNVGIVPELVKHEVNGLIIERTRSNLKSAINLVLNNPELLVKMHQNLLDISFPRYNKAMAESYYDMFEYVIQQ